MLHNTNIDEKTIKAIESILERGERVELIPVKEDIKVMRVRREEVKDDSIRTTK